MISKNLKSIWAETAFNRCVSDKGEDCTPSKGAFSNYVTRLFKRDSLKDVTEKNLLENLNQVKAALDSDIKADVGSTGRAAEYLSLTLDGVINRQSLGLRV